MSHVRKLVHFNHQVDKQLSVPTSPNASLNMSFEEKMDVDNRSVYIGQLLKTTFKHNS